MTKLLSNIKNYINLKNNRLAKLYLLIFYALNAIYLYLEVSKNKLVISFNMYPEQQKLIFEKAQNITTITSVLDTLLFVINVMYFILNDIKYEDRRNKGVNEYLIVSFISLLSIIIASFILHTIFSVYFLFEPTILVTEVTILVLIIALMRAAWKFLLSKSKHAIL